jgi:phosphate uptake regulator
MPFRFLRTHDAERLDRIEAKVHTMLQYDRQEFDLAMSALFGEVVAEQVNDELRSTDQIVNALEREIRRELVVHVSVFGGIDTPSILVYMSIVKDVERLGDYAKNLLDLALDGSDFSSLQDADDWRSLAADVSEYISTVGEAFRARDGAAARRLLTKGDGLLDMFDDRVSALVRGDDTGPQAVGRALANRYIKRVVAHLMNLLSAVVMPVDKLDYFAEDPEDRPRRERR